MGKKKQFCIYGQPVNQEPPPIALLKYSPNIQKNVLSAPFNVEENMVISKDVWTLVEQESSSFQATRLQNSTFVINAFDFLHAVLRQFAINCKFGGEYCQMAVKFEEVLKKFLQCNLKPIFVFGGCTKHTEETLTLRINRLHRQLNYLSRFIQTLDDPTQDVYFTYIPIFAKETLVVVLNDLKIAHVTCDTCANLACVSLAAHLKCPVIADSGDLLLHEFQDPLLGRDYATSESDRFVFMPMRFLSFEPLPVMVPLNGGTEVDSKYCLIGHVFCPSASSIHKLPYHMRPFLPLYLSRPESGLPFALPPHIQADHMDGKSSVEGVKVRVEKLIDWLQKLENPWHVFEETILKYSEQQAVRFVHQLIAATEALKMDTQVGVNLASFLTNAPMSTTNEPNLTPTDLLSWLQLKENKQYDSTNNKILTMITKAAADESGCNLKNLFSHVPHNFLHFYRSGIVSPVMFARIFSHSWILNPTVEDLTKPPVSDCSMGMRFLQYCLSLGFAVQCGQLDETKPGVVVELSRIPPNLIGLRTIKLCPFFLPLTKDPTAVCHAFLRQQLGYTHPVDYVFPHWLPSIALTFSLWYVNQSNKTSGLEMDLFAYPPLLSVALCSCVIACGGVRDSQTIHTHFNKLADSFKQTPAFSVPVVHDINELQLIYMSLLSMVRMLDVITMTSSSHNSAQTPTQSFTVMHFLPSWVIFACSRLLHHMSIEFSAQKSSEERKKASYEVWLLKLSPEGVEDIAETILVFNQLIELVKNISTTVHPVKFDSTLDLIEPPPFPQLHVAIKKNTVSPPHHQGSIPRVQRGRGNVRNTRFHRGGLTHASDITRANMLSNDDGRQSHRGIYPHWFKHGEIGDSRNCDRHLQQQQPDQESRFVPFYSSIRTHIERNNLATVSNDFQANSSVGAPKTPIDVQIPKITYINQDVYSAVDRSLLESCKPTAPFTSIHVNDSDCKDNHTYSIPGATNEDVCDVSNQIVGIGQHENANDIHSPCIDNFRNYLYTKTNLRGSKPFPHTSNSTRGAYIANEAPLRQPSLSACSYTNYPNPRVNSIAETDFKQQRQYYSLSSTKSFQAVRINEVDEGNGDRPASSCSVHHSFPSYKHNEDVDYRHARKPFDQYINRVRRNTETSDDVRADARYASSLTPTGSIIDQTMVSNQHQRSYLSSQERPGYRRGNCIPKRHFSGNLNSGDEYSRQPIARGFRGHGRYKGRQEANSVWSMSAIQDAVAKMKSTN